ncbi:MAG: C40 family peptidase [Armatimonadota bacterium]
MTEKKLGSVLLAIIFALCSMAASAGTVAYKVKQGDTLWDLAKKHRTTPGQIARANGISENAILALGKTIKIPSKYTAPRAKSVAARKTSTGSATSASVKNDCPTQVACAPANDNLISTALGCRGSRYRRGGTGRGGFDCSGFTRYIFAKYGVSLPHSSAAQSRVGTPVSRDNLKSGDLVFFQTYRRGISHVGIYTGNGKFVHAATYGRGVRVDSLGSGYYSRRYRCARRIK